MTRRLRSNWPMLVAGAVGVWAMSYLGLYGFGWNDYLTEALPAYNALVAGHVWQFLTLAPGYGGSLELRAPFALLPGLWGGHEVAVYQAVSIPCLVAAALLAVWLVAKMRSGGHSLLARGTVFGLCATNPITLSALQFGHAEELLGGVLCVAAVLTAQRGRAGWSGVLLGLAIVNKQWALLAIGPVLLALPAHRWRALATAASIAVCFYVPLLLPTWLAHTGAGGGGSALVAASQGGSLAQPWQLWWFLGSHQTLTHLTFGLVKVRIEPAWVQTISHPLIVALGLPATLLAARRRTCEPMLLLAFLFAIRCALDTWDTLYYPLPFILALLAWEVFRWRRAPVLSLVATVVVWLIFVELPWHASADALAALFTLAAVPTLLALAIALYAPGTTRRLAARAGGVTGAHQAAEPVLASTAGPAPMRTT